MCGTHTTNTILYMKTFEDEKWSNPWFRFELFWDEKWSNPYFRSNRHPAGRTFHPSRHPSIFCLLLALPCLRVDASTDLGLQVSSKQLLRFAWCFWNLSCWEREISKAAWPVGPSRGRFDVIVVVIYHTWWESCDLIVRVSSFRVLRRRRRRRRRLQQQ